MVELPADLLLDSLRAVRGGQASRLGGIRRRAQRVRAHMGDARRLTGRSRGGHGCTVARLAGGGAGDETTADLPGNAKIPAGKGARAVDRITGAPIPRSARLEQ